MTMLRGLVRGLLAAEKVSFRRRQLPWIVEDTPTEMNKRGKSSPRVVMEEKKVKSSKDAPKLDTKASCEPRRLTVPR